MGCLNRLLGICVSFMAALHSIKGERCNYGSDPCTCKTSSFELNLKSLMDSRGGEDFKFQAKDTYTYYVQPCNKKMSNQIDACNVKSPNLVSCQQLTGGEPAYGLGVLDQYEATNSPEGFVLTNSFADTGDSKVRMLHLTIKCSDQEASFTFEGSSDPSLHTITYRFTLLTRYVCHCGGGGGISVGSIMVIIFFVLLILYIVGGVLFLKFVRKAQGLETIPNYSFWKDFPLLVKDGVIFTFRCCTRRPAYEKI